MISMAELVANQFARTLDPRRVTPTQNMVLDAIKHEAIRRGAREHKARARKGTHETPIKNYRGAGLGR